MTHERLTQRVARGATPEVPRAPRPPSVRQQPDGLLALQATAGNAAVSHLVRGLEAGGPLAPGERAALEGTLGHDLGSVHVHSGPAADKLAESLHASAFAVGEHIVLGSRVNGSGTGARRAVITHEAAHVVQQRGTTPRVQRLEDDPDVHVSLGPLDARIAGAVAGQVLGETQWEVLREFLRGMQGGMRSAPQQQQARIQAKNESFGTREALRYVGGYAQGIAEGLWVAVRGLAEALVTLVKLPFDITEFLAVRAPELAARYGPRLARFASEGGGLFERLHGLLRTLLADPVGSLQQLRGLLGAVKKMALSQVRALGRKAAAEVLAFLELEWFEYGRSIGKVVGQILFEVILAAASGFIGNLAKEAVAIAGRIAARVVTGVATLVRSLGRLIGRAMGWIEGLGRRLSGKLAEIFEAIKALLGRLGSVVDELAAEGALADTGLGVSIPVPPARGATVLESRALKPPRTASASTADLTPPKVHPSKVAPVEVVQPPTTPPRVPQKAPAPTSGAAPPKAARPTPTGPALSRSRLSKSAREVISSKQLTDITSQGRKLGLADEQIVRFAEDLAALPADRRRLVLSSSDTLRGALTSRIRGQDVLEEFAGHAQRSRAEGALKSESREQWGRREVARPGRSVPAQLERGQLAHEYADLLIDADALPRGLAREVSATLPGGKVRIDRVDFTNGVYYEIKPTGAENLARGMDQIAIYAEYMNRNYPLPGGRKWVGRVVQYGTEQAIGMFGLR